MTAPRILDPASVLAEALLDASPDLMRNLLQRGTVRPYYNGSFHPGGIDVDAACHPVSRAGRIAPNLWALGCLIEGPQFASDAFPRPGANSPAVRDAGYRLTPQFAEDAGRVSAALKKASGE